VALLQRIRTPFAETPAEEPVRARPRIRSVGELLRERREELDLDLDGIGAILRIKPAYLVALEQDRSHELPGAAYAIGFIRAYSRHLGLDEEAVLNRFKEESTALTAPPDLQLPVPLGERSLPGAAMLLIALILALCGYGTWYYLSTGDRARPERVAAVPANLQPVSPPGPAGAASLAPRSGNVVFARGLGLPPDPDPAPAPAAPPTPAAPTPGGFVGTPAVAAPAPVPAPAPPVSSGAAAVKPVTAAVAQRITIKAASDVWMQVRGADNALVFARVLKAGETWNVPRFGLLLRTGNAGALQIAVDGKPVPPIGTIGTQRRDVVLDPSLLLAGTAVRG
jgi:cytoskeleton protein RodZ